MEWKTKTRKEKKTKKNGGNKQRRDSKVCFPVQAETGEEKRTAKADRERAMEIQKVDPEGEVEEKEALKATAETTAETEIRGKKGRKKTPCEIGDL